MCTYIHCLLSIAHRLLLQAAATFDTSEWQHFEKLSGCFDTMRKIAKDKPTEFDPRKFMVPAMDEMQKLCHDRFERFGTAGNASKIKPITLDDMAARYADGSL